MERVEVVGGNALMVKTRQLGPHSWSCDVFTLDELHAENFLLEQFGESELEAVAMALTEIGH